MLRHPRPKSVSSAQLRKFWADFDQGKRRSTRRPDLRFDLSGVWGREPVAVAPDVLGTVRVFSSRAHLKKHLNLVRQVNKWGASTAFDSFVFLPVQILGVDRVGARTLERAYRAPDLFAVRNHPPPDFKALYGERLWKRMREKGVALDRLRSALGDAFAELREKMPFAWESELHLSNVLVLDFDPKTNKPLLAFIDHGFSVQTHVNK